MQFTNIKLLLTLSFFFTMLNLCAQEDYVNEEKKQKANQQLPVCPRVFIGPSVGINNNGGLFANNLEVGVDQHISLGAGFGIGLWGLKGYLEGKYYFKECYKGWALGLAVTRASGLGEVMYQDSSGAFPKTVTMRLLPQTNVALQGYRYFKLGKRHRLHISGGYSFDTSRRKFVVLGPNQPGQTLRTTMDRLAPGGLIIGFGFSFGL